MARPKPSSKAKSNAGNALQHSDSNGEFASQPICHPDGENDVRDHDLRQETPNRNLPEGKTLSKQKQDDEPQKEKQPEGYLHQPTKKNNSNKNRSSGHRKPPEASNPYSGSSEDSHNEVSSGQSSPRPASPKLSSRSRASKGPQKPSPDKSKEGHVMLHKNGNRFPHPLYIYEYDPARGRYKVCEFKTYKGNGPKSNKNKHMTAEGGKNSDPDAELRFEDKNNKRTRLPKPSWLDLRRFLDVKAEKLRHMNKRECIMIPEDRLKVKKKFEDIHMVAKRPSASVPVARPGMLITDKGGNAD